jgi:hypothetical protein
MEKMDELSTSILGFTSMCAIVKLDGIQPGLSHRKWSCCHGDIKGCSRKMMGYSIIISKQTNKQPKPNQTKPNIQTNNNVVHVVWSSIPYWESNRYHESLWIDDHAPIYPDFDHGPWMPMAHMIFLGEWI